MNSLRLPVLGSIVWASVEDARGFRKLRPAVVVTPSADIAAGKSVRVVAVTTRLPDPLPEDHVLLPWCAQGTARSGLRRKCAAVASWSMEARVDDLQVVGILPPTAIDGLLAKIAKLAEPPSRA